MKASKELLVHWWHYYGKTIYTLGELEEFRRIIDKYGVDKVLEVAVASYICSDGSPEFLKASINNNKVEELFASIPNIQEMDDDVKAGYNEAKESFLKQIKESYDH